MIHRRSTANDWVVARKQLAKQKSRRVHPVATLCHLACNRLPIGVSVPPDYSKWTEIRQIPRLLLFPAKMPTNSILSDSKPFVVV